MAKGIRYSEDDKRGWVQGFYAENPRPSVAAYITKLGISNKTFTDAKAKYQHEFETRQSQAPGTSGLRPDLQQRFLESLPDDAIKNWLYAEVDRLTAQVKDLENQLAAAKQDR